MNQHLQQVVSFIQQNDSLTVDEKNTLLKSLKDANKELEITVFKLDRTEKVKRTTAILLEETIEELEQKRKAVEAQNRELEIETALERVRARTMAMQNSNELTDASFVLDSQVRALGIKTWGCAFNIYGDNESTEWFSSAEGALPTYKTPREHLFLRYYEAGQRGEKIHIEEFEGEQCAAHYEYLCTIPVMGNALRDMIAAGGSFPARQVDHVVYFKYGYLLFISLEPVPDAHDIFIRFAKVFEQTYTRFLDLKKSEAQARESRIEAALERVRSRTMGMQRSEELSEVIQIVYDQFVHLNIPTEHTGFVMDYKTRDDYNIWIADPFGTPSQVTIPYFDSIYYNRFNEAKKNGIDFFATVLSFEEKNKFYEDLFKHIPGFPEESKKTILEAPGFAISTALLENVALYIENFKGTAFSDEENAILLRFGKVFQQTYTRFLDLQKAEQQAREAKIEAALERVRAKTMAMQHSDELLDAATLLFGQMESLGAPAWNCSFNIWSEDKKYATAWNGTKDGFGRPFQSPSSEDVFLEFYEAAQKDDELFVKETGGKELALHYDYLATLPGVGVTLAELKEAGVALPTFQVFYIAYFAQGYLMFITYEPVPEFADIFKRFAKVFEQTYTRFLDLQKAEAQSRESQIQLALERVRARTMAMQKSDELSETAVLLFHQLMTLELNVRGCGFNIWEKDEKICTSWMSGPDGELSPPFKLPLTGDPLFIRYYESRQNGEDFWVYETSKEELTKRYGHLRTIPVLGDAITKELEAGKEIPPFVVDHVVNFSQGNLIFITYERCPDAWDIFKRFGKVFEQTYTRFLDLQKAEAQAWESQIEAALERVRSRTLAMQKSEELAETAVVLFQQLIALGIEPNRLYIAIVKNEAGDSEFWITDEDGTKISTAFSSNLNDNLSFSKMFDGWKQQRKSLVIDMQGEELKSYFQHLNSIGVPFKGGLTQKRRVQDVAYFSHGFIGIASPEEQPEETLQLLERFAAVFNLTFTRFNDLKLAEAHAIQAEEDLIKLQTEKKRAEDALTELRAAQKQLVQSEKMASLGELTAGIAHEIQNPLNFVNNFSEVSNELIDEMKAELAVGNLQLALELANDISQNLEKINHHGKRADGIVKGMLQHSQTSGTTKEPTDINALADEYLRLAYHGLRAKDKLFNATIKTDFDKSIGKINIIPQDIGRVILNIITNAFYAVNEKKKTGDKTYEPVVSLITKKISDSIQVSVKDNGNGIPKNIVDKIFQPFFTTKPTGQGTGLGLSLAYDIVKAHGGELKVETKEGEGTIFIIHLPKNN